MRRRERTRGGARTKRSTFLALAAKSLRSGPRNPNKDRQSTTHISLQISHILLQISHISLQISRIAVEMFPVTLRITHISLQISR